jgi:DNA-binding winged helix-turn-helix (wHTH) protein
MSDETGRRAGSKNIREPLFAATGAFGQDTAELYEFGPFRLEPAERKLWRRNEVVVLTPKAFDTLVLLVRNSGHLLEKDELIRALWPDSFVEEGNLTNNISLLRKVLGDDPPYVETIPKRGYRFIGAVRQLTRKRGRRAPDRSPHPGQVARPTMIHRRRAAEPSNSASKCPAAERSTPRARRRLRISGCWRRTIAQRTAALVA